MEVHHHPKVEKKNFKEYFLEFLMIFLAVTLGFFAENIREYFVNLRLSNEYLESFQEELKQNKKTIYYYHSVMTAIVPKEDSIIEIFFHKTENENLQNVSRLIVESRKIISVPLQTGAYLQMVNSGGLKYINDKSLKDSMANYEGLIQLYSNYNAIMNNYRTSGFPEISSLEDLHDDFGEGHIPEISPFPSMTEKERRFIIAFYRLYYRQYLNDKKLLNQINESNQHLISMIDKLLTK